MPAAKLLFYLATAGLLPVFIFVVSPLLMKRKSNYLFLGGFLALLLIYQLLIGDITLLEIYIFILLGIFIREEIGGLIAGVFSLILLLFFFDFDIYKFIYHTFYFSIIILFGGELIKRVKDNINEIIKLNLELSNQVKELRALREISAILQGTLELEKVLHIILSAVTAGYSLEFNRAVLFLVNKGNLRGEIGIGPLNKEEGWQKWQRVASDKINIEDMLEIQEEVEICDEELNEIIKRLQFDLGRDHLAARVIKEQKCYNIKELDLKDEFQAVLSAELDIDSFAVVPLLVKGEAIGVLCVDNIVNGREITYKDIDSLLPFANQAALAIHNAKLHELKEEMAITDNLTGLYNQRYFQQSLEDKLTAAREDNYNLGLLILDIDHFKIYNDNNGHPAGNEALARLAKILKLNVRQEDIACRFGGEEFAIILPRVSKKELINVAQRIRKKVAKEEFEYEESQPTGSLTVSIGAAIFPDDALNSRELLNTADKMLYKAKDAGRNNVKCSSDKEGNKDG